jgi:hypothetical protein
MRAAVAARVLDAARAMSRGAREDRKGVVIVSDHVRCSFGMREDTKSLATGMRNRHLLLKIGSQAWPLSSG